MPKRQLTQLRNIRKGLTVIVITMFAIEFGLLRWMDPLGAHRYYTDLARLHTMHVRTPDGYGMYPGMYQFSNWHALILPDGTRYVPDATGSDCRIAFLGDSVTFGQGVSDADTFVNLIAGQVEARLVNTGTPGYSSHNVLAAYESYPADGYVYLVFWNDDHASYQPENPLPTVFEGYHKWGFESYMAFAQRTTNGIERERFTRDIEALRRDDVLMVVFEDARGWYVGVQQVAPEVVTVPHYRSIISAADPHADVQGNREIAAALLEHVQSFEDRICESNQRR